MHVLLWYSKDPFIISFHSEIRRQRDTLLIQVYKLAKNVEPVSSIDEINEKTCLSTVCPVLMA